MKFFYLGNAAGILTPFSAKGNVSAISEDIKPTLSPRDSKFMEWYKKYEADKKKSEGPTPDEK